MRSRYVIADHDEAIAIAHGRPVDVVHAAVLRDEIAQRMESHAEYRGAFARGYRSAMTEILELLLTRGA
jgi:hypothetical protein